MRTMPKGITNHPGVKEADLDNDGFAEDLPGGFRADVILKEDWHFAGLDGNAEYWDVYEKRRTGFFATLAEFKAALPTQYTPEEMAASFVVQRIVGKHSDYLHQWCEEWGTSCIGSLKMAMTFATKAEAEAAAQRAQRECRGAGGMPAAGVMFIAREKIL